MSLLTIPRLLTMGLVLGLMVHLPHPLQAQPAVPDSIRQKAAAGDTLAQYTLANHLFDHHYKSEDSISKGFELLEAACDSGMVRALLRVMRTYETDSGTSWMDTVAMTYCWRAVYAGSAEAEYLIAERFRTGTALPVDSARMLKYMRRAADKNYTPAMVELSRYYAKGMAVAPDPARARELVLRAARLGDPEGQTVLGYMYLDEGTFEDDRRAIMWFRKAAAQNHPRGLFSLGLAYFDGIGVRQDEIRGQQLLREAYELGSAEAADILAEEGLLKE